MPDERIAWQGTSVKRNDGIFRFEPLGIDKTRVEVEMAFEPEGVAELVGSGSAFPRGEPGNDCAAYLPAELSCAQRMQSGNLPMPRARFRSSMLLPSTHRVLSWYFVAGGLVEYHGPRVGITCSFNNVTKITTDPVRRPRAYDAAREPHPVPLNHEARHPGGPRCVSMRLRRSAGEIWLPPVRPAAQCEASSLLR